MYELGKASFQRLIARRSPETLELLRKVVITKLRLRVERLNEIPLFKYLLELAISLPHKEKLKALKKKRHTLEEIKPLANRWQGIGKAVKASMFLGGQAAKKSETKNNPAESKGDTTYKEKELKTR